ncbi:HYR domain-containing protein [Agromyces larvae]|uniref:HYR domain-containing protein n=1 Tax=Agromyces larvae TaxID=2929802 RepID=A0ABY4BZ64_9MICO|nr:HYR domain-containing protein [Agromyces larvae]UOE43156.1 HYR domain-containing protein [Agromyces larvae]
MSRARSARAATRRRAAAASVAVAAATGLLALGVSAPAFAAPPDFTDPPTRLYMAPADSLPVSLPDGFPTIIPEGELKFDGSTDLISQDVRSIVVESGEQGCAMVAPDWPLGGCTAVQLSVSHGELTFDPLPSVEDDGDSDDDVLKFPDGALERDKHLLDDLPAPAVALIGTTAQVNAALQTLVYLPDTDEDDDGTADDPYSYNGANPETLLVQLGAGDPAIGTASMDVEIRVQKINGFPEVTVPDQVFQVPSGGTGFLGDAGSDVGEPDEEDWNVVDEDNDEQDDNDTLDGPGDEWLLIAWADCGMFSMPASPFSIYEDLEQLMQDTLDFAVSPDEATEPEAFAEYEANKALVIEAAMNALPDEVKNLPFATGNPSDPHSAFAGVVSGLNAIDDLNYVLDQVEFDATGLADVTCTVRFLVSDLGNNGLPLQYLGDPPYGIQVPFFGFDFDTNDFPTVEKVVVEVGEGTEIQVAMPTDVSIPEGSADVVPITVTPTTHPAFDVIVSTSAVPPTSATDFSPITAQTFTIPENAASIDIPVDALDDDEVDPDETYFVSIDGFPADPPFPPGFDVSITDGTATVTIIDTDVPVDTEAPTVTINQGVGQVDPTSVSPIVFDVQFSEPVTGFTNADVVLSGSANPTTATVVAVDGDTYTVEVSGMNADGLVIAEIPAGAAQDVAANLSEASTTFDNQVTFQFDEGDVTAPTVTINQGAAQVDPTSVLPIVFDILVSEAVAGFAASDVLLDWTGPGVPTATLVPGATETLYTLEVDGLLGDGTLTASIPAAAFTDAANLPNAASLSTDNSVTYVLPTASDPLTITAPDDIVVTADPGESGANVDFPPPTVTGGIPPITTVCDAASGDFFPIGVTTVTCTATDSAPPEQIVLFAVVSDSFTITVNEATEPGGPGEDPGGSGGSGGSGGGSGGAGAGPTGRIASTGAEAEAALLAALALLLAGAAAVRIGQRRREASAHR